MSPSSFFISPNDLWLLIGTAGAPQIMDVRRREAYQAASGVLPTANWYDANSIEKSPPALDRSRPVVAACKEGHERSQMVAAELRARGFDAHVLAGGHAAWAEAGLPFVAKAALERFAPHRPSLFGTRRRSKIVPCANAIRSGALTWTLRARPRAARPSSAGDAPARHWSEDPPRRRFKRDGIGVDAGL